jgi:carboxyl-terminal processing protease
MKLQSLKKMFRKRNKLLIIGILISSLLTYSFIDRDFEIIKNLDIFFSLFREVNTYYVDEPNPETLINDGIEGMLKSLDPYTMYIPEDKLEDYKFITTGEYGGIGAYIQKMGDNVVIEEVIQGYSADQAGIKPGDIILKLNGENIKNKTNQEIGDLLKGDPNTKLEVTYENGYTHKKETKNLLRQIINIKNISYYGLISDNIGFIKLSNFTANAHIEIREAWLELKNKGAKYIMLDLRNNPGGLLIEAVDIANLFLSKNQLIVKTRGRAKQWDKDFVTTNEPIDTTTPMAILVNKNTASAAEIISGSMQDLDRAVILGQKTYGKGLVQTTRDLSYNTKLKITTAKYYIPSGRCIQARDYAHKNAKGEAVIIADSLTQFFWTKNRRRVKDAGGIEPDIKTSIETLSSLTLNLYNQNIIFNYSTQYYYTHQNIPEPIKFKLSEKEYEDFVKYITQSGFEYQNETEKMLAKLKETALKEGVYDQSKNDIESLKTNIQKSKKSDFSKYKSEIKEIVEEEITGRYFYEKGKIEASLPNDSTVLKAKEILLDSKKYQKILGN